MKGTHWAARRRAEDGFTLVEAVVAVGILGIIGVVIAGAFIVSARTTQGTTQRYNESHDAQIASAYLATDVQSNNQITGACGGSGSNLVSFGYSDGSVASYLYSAGAQNKITRTFCSGGSTTTTPLVQFAGSAPTVTCTGGCAAGDKPTKVKIAITESSGYSYTLAGSRRINRAPGSVTSAGPIPPLLALGSGGIAIDLNGQPDFHVGGDIIVNSNSSSAVSVNNNAVNDEFTYAGTLYIFTGGDCTASSCVHTTRNTRVPDPLAGLPAPPSSGPNVYVHTTQYTPSGTIEPGIHILTAGLKMNGGNATGTGVMFYVTGGSVDIGGNASLSLTPPALEPYGSLGLVVWQPPSNTAPMSIGGTGGSSSLSGLVYAPTAAVTLNGSGELFIRSIIANSVRVVGGGSGGGVCVNLPAPCA